MTFAKSTYCFALAITCASIMLGATGFLLFVLTLVPSEMVLFYALFAGGCFLSTIVCLCFALECKSKVEISEEGITLHSKFCGKKFLSWNNCSAIGLYGYSYGVRGWMFFSQRLFACNSQKDCRIFAQKNQKSIIMVDYSPKVFTALEQYAPLHLVSQAKRLLRH